MAGVQRHMRPAFTTAAALLFRAALAYFFSDVLERAPQISTPFHSSAAAREARALIKLGLSPYAGEAYHGGPLLLLALPDDVAALPFVLADAVTIFAATAIANAFDAKQVHTFALVHAWNPWAILACAARSTATLDTALCVGALACAAHEQGLLSGVLLALCLNVLPGSVLPILLMLPCLALLSQRRRISLAVGALATTIPVAAVNCLLCTHWGDTPFAWLDETFGAQARTESLVPNMGLSWYLQIQTFPEYRRTMQCVMYMHVGALAVPAWLRLRSSVRDGDVIRHRRVAMHAAALVATSHLVFRPYPSAADVATTVLISAVPLMLFKDDRGILMISYVKGLPVVTLFLLVFPLLYPVLYYLWAETDAANANFLWWSCLFVNGIWIAHALAQLDAALRFEEPEEERKEPACTG
ncbi:GPI-anchor transamidase subunit U [Pycnococcus provasolii]